MPVECWAVVATFSQPLQTPNRHTLLCDSRIGHPHRCQDCQLIAPQPQVTCSYTHLRACAIGGPKGLGYRKATFAWHSRQRHLQWLDQPLGSRLPAPDISQAPTSRPLFGCGIARFEPARAAKVGGCGRQRRRRTRLRCRGRSKAMTALLQLEKGGC